MEKIEALLSEWRKAPVRMVPAADLHTDAALQPRVIALAPYRDRGRLESASEEHIERMTADFLTFGDKQPEPLLVAECEQKLLIVDGHHRLAACKAAKRELLPAQVIRTDHLTAAMVSKLANCDGAKLPLHREQAREAAWQYLAHLTSRGRLPLPTGLSTRKVAARIGGLSHSTVSRMLTDLRKVELSEFDSPALDPATRWPRWKYVKKNPFRDAFNDTPPEVRFEHDADKLAKKIAGIVEKVDPRVARRAIELLLDEKQDELRERLAEWADVGPDDY